MSKETKWRGGGLTTTERADIILKGIEVQFKCCQDADDVDEFVDSMARILWPDVIYERRAKVWAAEEVAKFGHPLIEGANYEISRKMAYRTCAIELLADVLDDLEKLQDQGTGTAIRPGQHNISRSELPNWVRYPGCLYSALDEEVIGIIKEVNKSKYEPTWKRKITTHQRAEIIRARIQRRFNKRVTNAVVKGRPTRALFELFDTNFAVQLRPLLMSELRIRRETHESTWNRTNGIWMIVECVLVTVLEDCEERELVINKISMHQRLLDWIGEQAALRFTSRRAPSGSIFPTPWSRYSV
ncbi:hypothetical protein GGR58DRAFT_501735 [Xylaria digitata]|nr:hypothetical protein GGR58DRAFT_501735 [Xylaria digitata]